VNHFVRRRGELYCERVPLARIAHQVGTPAYVYSTATLLRHARVLRGALRGLDVLPCYAVKAAGNLAVLSLLAKEGFGFDIVSGGELHRVLRAGADPRRVVFSGVGKRDDELRAALRRVRLDGWLATLPDGLGTWLGAGGATMSGGQARRLATARALLADPEVLILDEPTEGLDTDLAEALMADLLDAAAGRTVLLLTHRPEGLDRVDEVIDLATGRSLARVSG
jgi:hypothetical protein